jgi:hypothetical protein
MCYTAYDYHPEVWFIVQDLLDSKFRLSMFNRCYIKDNPNLSLSIKCTIYSLGANLSVRYDDERCDAFVTYMVNAGVFSYYGFSENELLGGALFLYLKSKYCKSPKTFSSLYSKCQVSNQVNECSSSVVL